MPPKIKQAATIAGLVALTLLLAYAAERGGLQHPHQEITPRSAQEDKETPGDLQERPGDLHTLTANASNRQQEDSRHHQVLLEGHDTALEAVVIDRRVYDYQQELDTDITGYAVFDVDLTNNSSETVTINRSVNSCLTNGIQHTYERDTDPETAPRPILVDIDPGQEIVLSLACDTHDTSADLEYVLQVASSTSN